MELIVAFDGTQESENALLSAINLAEQTRAPVTAVYAVEPTVSETETDGGVPIIEGYDTTVERGDGILRQAEQIAETRGYDIGTDLVEGAPVDAVIDYATAREEAAIFVGHRAVVARRTSVGSVAHRLIRDSPVPVTVVN